MPDALPDLNAARDHIDAAIAKLFGAPAPAEPPTWRPTPFGHDPDFDGGQDFDQVLEAGGDIRFALELAAGAAAPWRIGLKAGRYRPASARGLKFPHGCTVSRVGREVPVIDGAVPVDGWLRDPDGVAWATVKAPASALLLKDGRPVPWANVGADPAKVLWPEAFDHLHETDGFMFDDAGEVYRLRDARLGELDGRAIANVVIGVWHKPNAVTMVRPTTGGPGWVEFDPLPSAPKYNRFSLWNVIDAIAPGHYAYADHDDGTITLHYNGDPAGLSLSTAEFLIDMGGGVSNLWLEGIYGQNVGGSWGPNCIGFGTANQVVNYDPETRARNLGVRHCRVRNVKGERNGYGAFYFACVDGVTVERCSADTVMQGGGLTFSACTRAHANDNLFVDADHSPFRASGRRGRLVSFDIRFTGNVSVRCGKGAHVNKVSLYQGIDRFLVWGNLWIDCPGYITFQEASNGIIAHNVAPAGGRNGDGRAIHDQLNGWPEPDPEGLILIFNNACGPIEGSTGSNAITVGRKGKAMRYVLANNVAHGCGPMPDAEPGCVDESHNSFTARAWWRKGAPLGEGDELLEAAAAYDPQGFAGRPGGEGFASRAGVRDVRRDIPADWFPEFDFAKGMRGRPIDYGQRGVAPMALKPEGLAA